MTPARFQILPRSIVARTTLLIVVFATVFGALFAILAARMLQAAEAERLQTQLEGLLGTVESTASIACFVQDRALAEQVVEGLLRNEAVIAAQVAAGGVTLAQRGPVPRGLTREAGTISIARAVHSPFAPDEVVGAVTLYASRDTLQALAWSYSRYVVGTLALQVALIAAALAAVVYALITRPIKSISDELHRLEVRAGMRLRVPARNARDELGRLVADVNALIGRLTAAVDAEHGLRLAREASERRLSTIFERVDAGLFEVDRTGRLGACNPAFVRTLGALPDPPRLQALMPAHEQALLALIAASLDSGTSREADFELPSTGALRWVSVSLTPMDGQRLQGVVNDISERKRSELAAQQLAARDVLTGLLNRRGLEAGLAAAFERRAREPGLALTVLQVDLDWFKQVNDTYGHSAGDRVLRRVAEILERAMRRTDLIARTGGDEFSAVLIGTDSPAKAGRIARAIIEHLAAPIDLGGGLHARIGASIGIAVVDAAESSAEAAIARADAAMYAAKQGGRNQACFAPPAAGGQPRAAA